MPFDYDAFVSYRSDDAVGVEALATRLRQDAQLHIFLHRWNATPDESWNDASAQALDRSAACVLCIGARGFVPWNHGAFSVGLQRRVLEGLLRVIPLLLPGASTDVVHHLPRFLRIQPSIDSTAGLDDNQVLEALHSAIDGSALRPPAHSAHDEPHLNHPLGTLIAASLVPVAQFQNRPELDALRAFWSDPTRKGVVALVGIGGSGKTALLCRWLQKLPHSGLDHPHVVKNTRLPAPDGVFAWSFYDTPHVEHFMHALYVYLTGEERTTAPARDLTYRVLRNIEQHALRRVLLVLDGIEVVQEDQESAGSFGLLRDTSLRHLVRRIARGDIGVRMLLTSRFPLPDMDAFAGSGYAVLPTDHLDPRSARRILRARGVVGTDAELDALVRVYGSHALTLDQLGTVLRDFFQGSPYGTYALPPLDTAQDHSDATLQVQQLARMFAFYAQHLPPVERHVLDTLCVFHGPVDVTLLIALCTRERDDTDPAFPSLTEHGVLTTLARLHRRRLVSVYETNGQRICAVHPTIRAYFYRALGPRRTELHTRVHTQLLSLTNRPDRAHEPVDAFSLDILEASIFHAVQADHLDQAMHMYGVDMGGYVRLGWRLSEYQRGLRITALLVEAGGIALEAPFYSIRPWYDHSLYLLDLGQVARAETQMRALIAHLQAQKQQQADSIRHKATVLRHEQPQRPTLASVDVPSIRNRTWRTRAQSYLLGYAFEPDAAQAERELAAGIAHLARDQWLYHEAFLLQSLCDVLLLQGKLAEAEQVVDEVITTHATIGSQRQDLSGEDRDSNAVARRARVRFLAGKTHDALQDFQTARDITAQQSTQYRQHLRLGEYHTALEISCLARVGKLRAAHAVARPWTMDAARADWPLLVAHYALALADMHLASTTYQRALPYLLSAHAWSLHTGHQETYVRAQLGQARVFLRNAAGADAGVALREAEHVARTCGFTIWLVDIIIGAAHRAFQQGDLDQTQERAHEALTISTQDDCGYLWGRGDATHLLAEVAFARGQRGDARQYALTALQTREHILDPKAKNTQLLLQRL